MTKKYDVAILGWWHNSNYGSIMTYYALNKAILEKGYSTLLVNEALGYPARNKLAENAPAIKFTKRQGFDYTEQTHFLENDKLNEQADTFIVGSDQLWNPFIPRINDDLFLSFTKPEKKRIAYGTSIGNFNREHFQSEHFGMDFEAVQKQNLERFDWISMREDDGIEYFKKTFSFDVPQVVDPVFLIDPQNYRNLADMATYKTEGRYMLAFILDPNEDKRRGVQAVADKLGYDRIVIYTDANPAQLKKAREIFDGSQYIFDDDIRSENWLNAYQNAGYVVTDSFHGSAFAFIFQKPFSVFYNKIRGTNRFSSLMRLFKLEDSRRIYEENTTEDIQNNPNVSMNIDFSQGNQNLAEQVTISDMWLQQALQAPKAEDKILSGATMLANREAGWMNIPKDKKVPLLDALLSNKFVFYREAMHGEVIRQDVQFLPDGFLGNVSNVNEAFWKLEGNKLLILSKDKQVTTRFENLEAEYSGLNMRIVGEFVPNPQVKHVLETQTMSIKRSNDDPDFARVKLLVTKLRDYGVKDIILAAGGRDVVLNRAFENNQNVFNIHYVIDERSAGYFALGVANKTKRPTAVVVTSGTAASNLAPAMTEAYYMNLPLIAITADRYVEYHGIGEDQTVEQAKMFEPMIRRSVDLSNRVSPLTTWQSNRLISHAILDTQYGPTHINVPIHNLPDMAPIHLAYKLLPVKHIKRISAMDTEQAWQEYADILLKSKRILLIYRQNYKPTAEEQEHINAFAERYNVTILADWLSNIHGPQVVHPYIALSSISQAEFNEKLLPEVVLTVGTKNTMNHPINFKLRGAPAFRHWDVDRRGELRDMYFHLSTVFNVTDDWFFKKFGDFAQGKTNDNEYLKVWQDYEQKYPAHHYQNYNSHFVTQKLLEAIPENSLFHIGVGTAFIQVHSDNTVPNKNLEVFLNMGTNGIDGSASSFMGQVAVDEDPRLKFLIIGDVSFFYDMNSIWNKELKGNIRILLINNGGSGLLEHYGSKGSRATHTAVAEGWVKSLGFTYLSARNKEEFETGLERFVSSETAPLFFEVFL
ncbi:2-succinyl-5-enolpyruvyl-6-hydroxy-3-cyclohexene-1-carboxylic-acid synthase [Lactococcus cremoris]|uniref:2-succinyl-5-enolpyruvyl-6-hydroxy-3- cyclohexene-1-carboxylic-acid synthase n=1 Tax=Lactococcus lactis subsp. cremoris TaxID=1359 RepID=UPI0003AB5A56|nr:2-succinyl-5-enolpyruvyl-6-hydroxy-3-cyclohexene-1-carboxylic-acid synthase [Lactococcus cremoris]AGV72868.1 polysaccharide pyruvyl transferase [Lactococcus cremoris subsp. cremoris KW2]